MITERRLAKISFSFVPQSKEGRVCFVGGTIARSLFLPFLTQQCGPCRKQLTGGCWVGSITYIKILIPYVLPSCSRRRSPWILTEPLSGNPKHGKNLSCLNKLWPLHNQYLGSTNPEVGRVWWVILPCVGPSALAEKTMWNLP